MKGVAVLEIRLPFVKIIFDRASTLEAAIPMGVDVEHVNGGTDAKSPKSKRVVDAAEMAKNAPVVAVFMLRSYGLSGRLSRMCLAGQGWR
jgi:hypothetical protein